MTASGSLADDVVGQRRQVLTRLPSTREPDEVADERRVRPVTALVRRDPCRRVVLVSGPSDGAAAKSVMEAARAGARAPAGVISADEYDLPELRALVARAAVYIGGDSGPLHVAATTTTPIVELLGPTLAERSRPWRDARWFSEVVDAGDLPCRPCHQRRCVTGDFRCLTGISADRVIEAA